MDESNMLTCRSFSMVLLFSLLLSNIFSEMVLNLCIILYYFVPASSKDLLDIQATIECGLNLKRVRDMTRTYSQMLSTDKYSKQRWIIWPVWANAWAFVFELNAWGFESSCSHITLKFYTCFEHGVLWHSGNYSLWILSETPRWHRKIIQSNEPYR